MREMDAVFRALGDPARRRLLDRLNERNGLTPDRALRGHGHDPAVGVQAPRRPGGGGARRHPAAGPGEAALPERRPHQRHRRPLDPPLRPGAGRGPVRSQDGTGGTPPWTTSDQTTFVYTTYIHATPERVWQGLTDPAFTTRYWRHPAAGGLAYVSDWQKGSTYDVAYDESGLVVSDPEQVILESDPYRRLAYTWHTFTPEWAARHGFDEATVAAWRAEPRSKVAFDIEDAGQGVVKLTVVHDGFEPGSGVLQGVSGGWPAVLASLKTLLETGSASAVRLTGGLPSARARGGPDPGWHQSESGGCPPCQLGALRRRILSILLRNEAVMSVRHALSGPAQRGPQVRAPAAPGVRGPHRRGLAAERRAGVHDAAAARARRAGRVRRLGRGGPAEGLPHHRGGRGRAGTSGCAPRPTSRRRPGTSW